MATGKTIRIAFAFLAIGFFATPIAARLTGVEAEQFENRRLAVAPEPSQGWDAFQQTSRYLTDHMPLREQAVRLNTTVWRDVFGTDPRYDGQPTLTDDQALPFAGSIERDPLAKRAAGAARAQSGKGGWAYVEEEFEYDCISTQESRAVLQRWARVVQAIRDEGHDSAMVLTPSKGSIYPEHLPDSYTNDHCSPAGKRRFWKVVTDEGPALGVSELRNELVRLKERAGNGLFQRTDSHWTTLGATTLVTSALDAIGGDVELKRSEIVSRDSVSYTGDLSIVGGSQKTDTRAEFAIVRERDAPRVPGKTLLVCDSFAYLWLRLFKPYFDDIHYISLRESPSEIAAEVERADTVIVEANEILAKAQGKPGKQAPAIVRALERRRQ